MESGLVAVSNKVDLSDIGRVVVEHALCHKVVVSCRPRVELKANYAEALALNKTVGRIGLEGVCGV